MLPLWAWYMPTLNPANIAEYIDLVFMVLPFPLLRNGWVLQAILKRSKVPLRLSNPEPKLPHSRITKAPEGGLNFRWPIYRTTDRSPMVDKIKAVHASPEPTRSINQSIYSNARMGIITTGKAHLDLMGNPFLGVDEASAREFGIDYHKIGLVWAIETINRRAPVSLRQRRSPRHRRKAWHHRKPAQGIALRLSRRQNQSAWWANTMNISSHWVTWTAELSPSYLRAQSQAASVTNFRASNLINNLNTFAIPA